MQPYRLVEIVGKFPLGLGIFPYGPQVPERLISAPVLRILVEILLAGGRLAYTKEKGSF